MSRSFVRKAPMRERGANNVACIGGLSCESATGATGAVSSNAPLARRLRYIGWQSRSSHLAWNMVHEESAKMSWTWSSFPSGRQIGLRSEPVTDLRIGEKVFGRVGVVP